MKKLVLSIVFGTVTLASVACTNPSMEDGLNRLEASLAELGAAIEALNIPQMQADLETMNAQAEGMLETALEAQQAFDVMQQELAATSTLLDGIIADSQNWATSEQMAELLEQTQQFNHDVETLVLAADYDHDGVINALDKCPDTPLDQINNVDALGCAPGDTTNTGN